MTWRQSTQERAGSRFEAFYRTMDLTNPTKAINADQAETEQTNAAAEHTTAAASASSGSRSADRPAIVSADAQSKYGHWEMLEDYLVELLAFFSTSTDAVWAWCPGHR